MVLRCDFRWVTHTDEGMAWSCCRLRKMLQYRAKSRWEFIIRHPNACVRKAQAAERVFVVPCNNLSSCTCSWWQQHLGGHHHIPPPMPCCLSHQRPSSWGRKASNNHNLCPVSPHKEQHLQSHQPQIQPVPSEPCGSWCRSCERCCASRAVEDRCAFRAPLARGALARGGCAPSFFTGHDKALPAPHCPRDATVTAKSSGSELNLSFLQISSVGGEGGYLRGLSCRASNQEPRKGYLCSSLALNSLLLDITDCAQRSADDGTSKEGDIRAKGLFFQAALGRELLDLVYVCPALQSWPQLLIQGAATDPTAV